MHTSYLKQRLTGVLFDQSGVYLDSSAAAAEGEAKTDGADGAGDCGRFEDDFFERSFCGEVDHYSYEEEDEEEEDDDGEVSGGCR